MHLGANFRRKSVLPKIFVATEIHEVVQKFYNNTGNANYSIAYYVEEYVDRLGIEGEGRLLTYTEVNAMTTAQRTNGALFWLGSASSNYRVWAVAASGGLGYGSFDYAFGSGVRPVIIVSTSDIGA